MNFLDKQIGPVWVAKLWYLLVGLIGGYIIWGWH